MTDDMCKTHAQLVAELNELRRRLGGLTATNDARDSAATRLEADHAALVRHAAYGIYVTGVEDRFITVNPALVEMLGYESVDDLLSVRPSDLYEDRAVREHLIDTYRDAERVEGVETRWMKKDGTCITARLSGRPVHDIGGQFMGFEMIVEDVTHQRRLEDQLRQAQKMEAVGRLTGGIAHDFNNLLAVILSNAELIGGALPPDAVQAREDLNDLKDSAERGSLMIKKLLGFSRHDELEFRDVDLRSLAGDMTRLLERLLPDDIEVMTSIDREVGHIRADHGAIEQVILNLATNARDAMPQGGRLQVEVERQHPDAAYCVSHPWVKRGRYVCVSVTDTGVGMDEETQRRVFEPFFTTKPAEAGSGLGMSMVYGLVKQHGGFVHVYSEKGHGTVVKVHFPEAGSRPLSGGRCVSYESVALAGSATILLTEDETALRRATKRVLETQGYSVLAAADGEEALATLDTQASEIDLVISDLVMPRLGGADLYEAVKRKQPSIRFLMTSGFSISEMQQRTTIDPAVPCLQKPWTVSELLWSVRGALEGNNGEAV
jgi:PAS domain S-box-containing protein